MSRSNCVTGLLLTALLGVCGGCAVNLSGEDIAGVPPRMEAGPAVQWPAAPHPARLRHVDDVESASDWGIARGLLGRIADSFTGRHESRLIRPTGVAERGGVLYVADPGAQAVLIFDANRHRDILVRRLGNSTLVSPVALTPGPADGLLLVDSYLKSVFLIDRDGKLLRVVVDAGLARPAGIAFDAARGRIYVADSMAHRVLVFATDGQPLGSIGGNGLQDGQFNSPTHLGLLPDGRLLVTDALNFRVQVFDPEGRFLAKFGAHGDGAGDFAAPKGVAADSLGHIYVADAMFDAIQVFDSGGRLLLGIGEQGQRPGQFWLPNGIFVSAQDRLYVADAYNRRVQVLEILHPSAAGDAQP